MDLLSPKEWLQKDPTTFDGVWMYGLDILDHCLQEETFDTFWKCSEVSRNHARTIRKAMQNREDDPVIYEEIEQNSYIPGLKYKEVFDTEGEVDIDQYLGGDDRCFRNFHKLESDSGAINLVLDMSIASSERFKSSMLKRHKRCYEIAFNAEAEGRPCRVIAAFTISFPEIDTGDGHWSTPKKAITNLIVVKDFTDPIFPGIWGALETNETTNSFVNLICDYFYGTADMGNGYLKDCFIRNYIFDDEIISPNDGITRVKI